MEYLADTVAIIRHYSKDGKLGTNAKQLLQAADRGEHIIYISIFTMVEIMFLSESHRIPIDFQVTKQKIRESDNYMIVDLDIDIVDVCRDIHGLELHDRLIVATAKRYKVPILTSDRAITQSGIIEVIW